MFVVVTIIATAADVDVVVVIIAAVVVAIVAAVAAVIVLRLVQTARHQVFHIAAQKTSEWNRNHTELAAFLA